PEAKSILTGQELLGLRERGAEDEARRVIESIVDHALEANRSQVREILKQLFPPVEGVFGRFRYGGCVFRAISTTHSRAFRPPIPL
ncbi:MAG: hypothetical protein ACE5JU_23600, partial [Candidatus Binatia bacterium]